MKNKIKWRGTLNIPDDSQLDHELIRAKKELETLQEEERSLTAQVEQLQESFNEMATQSTYGEYAYVTYDDVSKLSTTHEYQAHKLIVVKAPSGTIMEIPNPEDVERYFQGLRQKAATHDPEAEEQLKREKDVEEKKYQILLSSKTDPIMVFTVENDESDSHHKPSEDDNPESRDLERLSRLYET